MSKLNAKINQSLIKFKEFWKCFMLIAIIKIIKISPIAEVLFSKFVQQQKKLPYYALLLFCFLFLCPWFMCFLASKIIWKTSVYWECRPNTGWPTFLGNLISNRIMKTHNKKCHDYYLNDEIRSFYTLFHDLNPDNWCILIESGGQSWNIRQTKWEQFWLALTSIFGLCFMLVCLIKSNCYSLIYSSLDWVVGVLSE